MLNTTQLSERELDVYRWGARDAQTFRADPYRHLYQQVFKAETAEYRLSVDYSDPDGETVLTVKFKDRNHECQMTFSSPGQAIERAIRFVAEHPAPRPCCHVDY